MPKWIADQRLYLSAEGQVVEESAPGRKTLLCAVGQEVPEETCRRYGLGPYAGTDGESEGESGEGTDSDPDHRHYWRTDGTCRCGAIRPEDEAEG